MRCRCAQSMPKVSSEQALEEVKMFVGMSRVRTRIISRRVGSLKTRCRKLGPEQWPLIEVS